MVAFVGDSGESSMYRPRWWVFCLLTEPDLERPPLIERITDSTRSEYSADLWFDVDEVEELLVVTG